MTPRGPGNVMGASRLASILVSLLVSGGLVLGLVSLGSGCAGSSASARKRATKNNAVVIVECPVDDAEVWIDDRFVAHVQNVPRGVSVRPGSHRLELRHDDYHTHYQIIELGPRERITLEVELAEILP